MEVLKIILTVLEVIASIALVIVVLVQSGKESGLSGAIAGSSEGFMSKNKSASKEAQLAKYTKIIASVFLALTFILNLF